MYPVNDSVIQQLEQISFHMIREGSDSFLRKIMVAGCWCIWGEGSLSIRWYGRSYSARNLVKLVFFSLALVTGERKPGR